MKDSTNGKEPIRTPRIRIPNSGVKKSRKSSKDQFNICGNQVTHFIICNKSFIVVNFSYNRKKISITYEVGQIMCIPFANEGKTQVKWVVVIGHKGQKMS